MKQFIETRPSYDDLGKDGSCPLGSAWSVYGPDDQIGSIGLLRAERVLEAAALVRKGSVFSLNWSLELPNPALYGRRNLIHTISFDASGTDDSYDSFFPQCSSQWDGLGHIRHPKHGYYQGYQKSDLKSQDGSPLGIEHWARRGIAGRFILADIQHYRNTIGRPIRHGDADETTVDDIEECLARQGTQIKPGDILLLRFGWIDWYEKADAAVRKELAEKYDFPGCGLSRSEETARWLWNRAFAAVAADNPAVEALPSPNNEIDGFLHYRLIPMLGMAIGEMFALDALAADCLQDGRYEGLFVSAPLNKRGGIGSTANALALK